MTSSKGNIFRVTGTLCGEFTGPGEFPTQRPVTRSFDVYLNLRPDKRLCKQPWGWWFETPSWSLWRQCNGKLILQPRSERDWSISQRILVFCFLYGYDSVFILPILKCPQITHSTICNFRKLLQGCIRCVLFLLCWAADKFSLASNLNTLRPRQNYRHFADDIFTCIFLIENVWISLEISLNFDPMVRINNIPALVQKMAWRRPGNNPLSELIMVSLLTHICVTRPQRVNIYISTGYLVFRWLQPCDFRFLCLVALTEIMMTTSNGNIFRVTGHLCREFTGPRWIPHTRASDAELWCFLWSVSE